MHQISICIHLIYCLNIIFFLSEWVYYTVYQPLYIWILQILLLYISNNELNNSISKSINTLEINMNSQIIFNFSIFNFRNHWDIELCWWHVHVYCSRFIEFHTFCPNLIYIYIYLLYCRVYQNIIILYAIILFLTLKKETLSQNLAQ